MIDSPVDAAVNPLGVPIEGGDDKGDVAGAVWRVGGRVGAVREARGSVLPIAEVEVAESENSGWPMTGTSADFRCLLSTGALYHVFDPRRVSSVGRALDL